MFHTDLEMEIYLFKEIYLNSTFISHQGQGHIIFLFLSIIIQLVVKFLNNFFILSIIFKESQNIF